MTQSQPPITGTTHTLPFDKLSPRDFERLCLWLVEREGYERAEHLGAAGSEQGRDIVAWREGARWAFQCKRVQRFGPQDALAEVKKVLALPEAERPVGLVFLVTCDVSANTRQQARARCAREMECHFWAGTELDVKVKRHPDIVEEFFQAASIIGDIVYGDEVHGDKVMGDKVGGDKITIDQKIINFVLGSTEQQRAQRNRRAMLELVRNTWVKGVLEQSLHGAAMIELGLEERADVIERPWDMVLQTLDQPTRPLPRGTKIVDVFDEMNRALLILGEPGSGKTTMLLELARETIARAEEDPTQPIPVVFNLSSWADKQQPIADWLGDELNVRYNIPKKTARPWVEDENLLLLLDGLDEVKSELQEACVEAINDFRQERGLTSLVVCSRVADYEALKTQLKLQGAVLLQPLTSQQVDRYLEGAGTELLAVHSTLQHDPTLQELAQTPLMLSIMTLAYQGMSIENLKLLDTIEARRRHVLDAYVQRMLERRGADQSYSPEQTVHWLAWLAPMMSQHAQTVFLIERMQPSWLQTGTQRRLYTIISSRVVGLSLGLEAGLALVPFVGSVIALVVALIMGLMSSLYIQSIDLIERTEALKWSWKKAGEGLFLGLVSGLIWGAIFGLIAGPIAKLYSRLLGEIYFVAMSWQSLGLAMALLCGLLGGLVFGLSSAEVKVKTIPNQGIRQSAQNCAILGLGFGLLTGLYGGLVRGLALGLYKGLIGGLALGLSSTQFVGLYFGGLAVIQHFTLRFILYRNGHIPWNYARFLDYAAERIFLRKVGGGYIFIHRLLQDYFASLDQGQ